MQLYKTFTILGAKCKSLFLLSAVRESAKRVDTEKRLSLASHGDNRKQAQGRDRGS